MGKEGLLKKERKTGERKEERIMRERKDYERKIEIWEKERKMGERKEERTMRERNGDGTEKGRKDYDRKKGR